MNRLLMDSGKFIMMDGVKENNIIIENAFSISKQQRV